MSKRRGKILTDPESVERRRWYADLQEETLQEVEKEKEFFRQEQLREQHTKDQLTPVKVKRLPILEKKDKLLVRFNSSSASKATIVCFPGISHGPGYFQKWTHFCTEAEIFLLSVCLPGRSNRAAEPCATSVRDTAIAVFLALKSMNLLQRKPHPEDTVTINRPLVFVGHDVGCLIAYEVAKLLQDYKYTHTALIMSACPSPYQQGQNKYGKKHCFLPDKELQQHMIALGGVPKYLLGRQDMLNYFLPLFRSDYYLYDKYVITPPATVLPIEEADLPNLPPTAPPPPPRAAPKLSKPSAPNSPGTTLRKAAITKEELPEEEEELVYPVVLYRLHCEIVTLLAEGDPFVTAKDVGEWVHMSNSHSHIQLESAGPGSHSTALFKPENEAILFDLFRRMCCPAEEESKDSEA